MRLHVLGSSGSYPAPGRPGSGFLVEQGDTRVWCDTGPGTFQALADVVDLDLVSAVVISHVHPDHCTDILAAFHWWGYSPAARQGIPLLAPDSVLDRIAGFLGADGDHPFFRVFELDRVRDGDRREVGALQVEFFRTDHSVPTLGSRWTGNGRVLGYTADTGDEDRRWRRLAEGVDLLLCEATYQEPPGPGAYRQHLTARQAGEIAREHGAGALMLTHVPAHLDLALSVEMAEEAFGRPVAAAVPGTRHTV